MKGVIYMNNNNEILFLSRKDVIEVGLNMEEVITITENVLREHGEGKVRIPSKPALWVKKNSNFHAMPGFVPKLNALGIKWASQFPDNFNLKYPTLTGLIILNDLETGLPICVMDGIWVTAVRTPAVTAIGIKYLARKNSKKLAIIGAGVQGRNHLEAINIVMNEIQEVRIADIRKEAREHFAKEMREKVNIDIKPVSSVKEAVLGADIVVTCTMGVKEPIIMKEWIEESTMIATIEGEPVWDPEIPFVVDKIVVDNWDQCRVGGQFFTLAYKGLIHPNAELGEIVAGKKPGREKNEEKIMLWARGMATEDVSLGRHIYNLAIKKGLGTKVNM
jgi:ornithine cyclodeaminase/alanine dehydrogenase-like protein (mu-crystallin family)